MLRYAVPALAAAGSAMAASCSTSGTTTLQNSGDASALASCGTYTGNIAVATGTTGGLDFGSLQRIRNGGISIENAPNVTSLSGESLTQIDQTWTLNNCQTLATLSFSMLQTVGEIDWEGLAELNSVNFPALDTVNGVFNLQNTMLADLSGINLKKCNGFYLANNNFLQAFSMQLANVSGSITLQSNGNRMNVTFPNLIWAENITIDNVPSISMQSLYAVNGSLGFSQNDQLETISLPNLTRVDQAFIIENNPDLESFSVPKLTRISGAANVTNNSVLGNITFPSLVQVAGAFDAYGNFTAISMPKITDIRGDFNVQSTQDLNSSCEAFNSITGADNIIKGGSYTCTGDKADATGTSDGTSGSSSSSGSGNTGAASPVRIPVIEIAAVVAGFGAIAFML